MHHNKYKQVIDQLTMRYSLIFRFISIIKLLLFEKKMLSNNN